MCAYDVMWCDVIRYDVYKQQIDRQADPTPDQLRLIYSKRWKFRIKICWKIWGEELNIIEPSPVSWQDWPGLGIIDGAGDGEKSSCVGLDHSNKSDLTDIEYYRLQVKMKRSAQLSKTWPGQGEGAWPEVFHPLDCSADWNSLKKLRSCQLL